MFNKVHYLNHSGFIMEGEDCVLVFDFYTDAAQVLSQYENCGKTVSFFVSHKHQDHWNPDIFTFRNTVPSYYFLDSSLALDAKQFTAMPSTKAVVHILREDSRLFADDLLGTGLDTLICAASTDEGLAFWISAEGQSIYHAGDLNNWDWSDANGPLVEQTYRSILKDLKLEVEKEQLPELLLAFVPVDRRLETKALSGACIFCEYFAPQYLVPMHLNGGTDLPAKLQDKSRSGQIEQLQDVEILDMTIQGQTVLLS